MPSRRELNWFYVVFMGLSPVAAVLGVGLYSSYKGLHPADLLSFWFMLGATGLAIAAGYHRYYAHRSYECHPALQAFYLLFGAAALQNSVVHWASDHRSHHQFVDQEGDPHNIRKGLFWAYMGWIFYDENPDRGLENLPDLKSDRLVMWQHRYYLPIGIAVGVVLPFLIGLAFGRPWGGFLWGGLLRVVVLHHMTFLFNLASHSVGAQAYSDEDSSRDNWWVAFLVFGEGYHNFHHAFPGDYRSGVARYHWDPTKWWIWGLSLVGLTRRLNRAPERAIVRARRGVDGRAELLLARRPEER